MGVLVASHTSEQLDNLRTKRTHGVLLSGPIGAGKRYLAEQLAADVLQIPHDKLASYPHLKIIEPDGTSISIDQIRNLQQFLNLRTPGTQEIRRVALIENAYLMTNEAQNALLKSLEEPPADTMIILTSPATKQLKETIYSRVRQVPVLPVAVTDAVKHFSAFTPDQIKRAYLMSGGQIGLMHALLHDGDHQLAQQVQKAKSLIAASKYERLLQVDEIAKQKDQLPLFLQACQLIATTALRQAASKGSSQTKRWHDALEAIYETEAALAHNPNAKLLLTDLFIRL